MIPQVHLHAQAAIKSHGQGSQPARKYSSFSGNFFQFSKSVAKWGEMRLLGPEPDALSNDEIIRRYGPDINQLLRAATDPLFDQERAVLINSARYQWLLVKGSNPGLGFNQNGEADWIPFYNGAADQEETGADIRLCPQVNFLGGDCFKFMAVMGSSSPRVKGVADDLRSPDDISSAHCADTNIRDLWTKNKIDRKWKTPAFHLYTTGPCFIRGFWNTDSVRYGESVEPKIEVVTGPDGLPVPEVVGTECYANGDAEISFHSVLEVSIPWEAKELRNNFLRLERMMSKWSLLAKYPGKDGRPGPFDQYRQGEVPDEDATAASTTAAEAEQAISVPSGIGNRKQNDWRFTEWWIPPHLFEAVTSEEARTVFKKQFGRGMYVARGGSVTAEIDEREVTDEWTVAPVNRGEKIMERPICSDGVPIHRAIQDLYGMAIETILRAITQTIIDSQLIDREAASTKEAIPAELILTALPVDGDLNKRIFQIPPAHLSDQALPLLAQFRAAMQDITGIRPELSGGGQPTATYREAKQRRDQALAQLAPQAQSMRDAAEDIARILVTLRSKYGSGTVKAQRKGAYGVETDVAEMSDLQAAGWHPEADDQFPLTLSDSRDAVYSLLKESPDIAQVLGMLDPLNIEELTETMGIPGFQSAIGEQVQKTLNEISRLLQGQPMPGEQGPNGQPGPPQPSIPVDAYDNHQLAASIKAKWMIAPVGQKEAGTPGFANVLASWAVQNQMAQPPQPPPPPALKGSVAWAGKLEDFPSLVPEILEGAGLPPPPPAAPSPALPPLGQPAPAIGVPQPLGAPAPAGKPLMASPIPPLPTGPPPMPVQ